MVWSLNVAKQILGNFSTQISKTHIILDITSSCLRKSLSKYTRWLHCFKRKSIWVYTRQENNKPFFELFFKHLNTLVVIDNRYRIEIQILSRTLTSMRPMTHHVTYHMLGEWPRSHMILGSCSVNALCLRRWCKSFSPVCNRKRSSDFKT